MFGRMMVSALALTGVAYAQETTPTPPAQTAPAASSDRVVYEAAYFSQFNPQTALDMVNNTPGFTLSGGDGRRGFSGAVGNVLIDGLRPSAKSQGIGGILAQIPASQVVRVELLRGSQVAGDASGQAVLINIVRTPSAGSGVYEVGFEYSGQYQDRVAPRGEISYSGRSGQFEWGVGARLFTQNRDLPGTRSFFDNDGTLELEAEITNPRDLWDPYLNANTAFPLLGGRFSATGQINPEWYFEAENDFVLTDPLGDPAGRFFSRFKEDGTNYEIGLNYDRDIGPWTLALVGLVTRSHYENHERAFEDNLIDTTFFTQDIERDAGETILRGSIARPLNERHRIEFGGETAVNTLESVLLFTVDDGGGPVIIPIPNSNVEVEEQRAEFFGVHSWRPSDVWSVETRLAWETSTLTFTGDAEQETELSFWKPSVQFSRTIGGDDQLRLRIYRDVGQLNFDDFVSSAGLIDAVIDGGNPSLQPQTDWRIEFGGDLRFQGGAAFGWALTHHDITDVNDQVPLVNNQGTADPADDQFFDAPGNIGDAEAWSLDLNLTLPLTRFLPGARLTMEAEFWDTEVTDPVTGQPRVISFRPESEVEISFRQDFREQRWSWGLQIYKQSESQGYRLAEIDTFEEGPWVDLWVETTALPNNMRLRAYAANIANGEVTRDRRIFGSDDGNDNNDTRLDPLESYQLSDRHFPTAPWLIVELSGTF